MIGNYRIEVDDAHQNIIMHWGTYAELLAIMKIGKIPAIQYIREQARGSTLKLGLKEAKEAIENLGFHLGQPAVAWTPSSIDRRDNAYQIIDGADLAALTKRDDGHETTVMTFEGGTVAFDTSAKEFMIASTLTFEQLFAAVMTAHSRFRGALVNMSQVTVRFVSSHSTP